MSTVIHLTPAELPKVLASHEKKMPEAIRAGIRLAAERGRTLLVRASPVDLGQFKTAWRVREGIHGPEIVNDAPHAGIIELGARPHAVSREGMIAIAAWAKRKILQSGRMSRKAYLASGKKLSSKAMKTTGKKGQHWADVEAMSIAWAIAGKLKKYGQKGKFIVRDNMPKLSKYLAAEVARQIQKVLSRKGLI